MIVRISTEGQYRLPGALLERLNQMDNRIVEAVEKGDEEAFQRMYAEMIAIVRKEGKPLPPEEIVESELVFPPPDITLEEAKELFTGPGVIPD